MTDIVSKPSSSCITDTYSGWIYKWTNYFRGYKKRWFVLQNGTLSYYRNNSDVPQLCRGAIFISHSYIHSGESNNFVITNSSSRTYHLKAVSLYEKQKWISVLEYSKAKHCLSMESDEETSNEEYVKIEALLKDLNSKIESVKLHNQSLQNHGTELRKSLTLIENKNTVILSEKINIFWTVTNSTINACNDFLESTSQVPFLMNKIVNNERNERLRLEDMIIQLGRQHSNLEMKVRKSMDMSMQNNDLESSDEEFYDTFETLSSHDKMKGKKHKRNQSDYTIDDYDSSDTDPEVNENGFKYVLEVLKSGPNKKGNGESSTNMLEKTEITNPTKNIRKYRKIIPERPYYSINLWSIIKSSIGKELSKIPMPVNFSEPLSFLQRLTEDYEYSTCLDQAVNTVNSFERLALVAAFTVSSYASTHERTFKPFNPLLGETFECDRTEDLGWRSIAEQVSHHPPMVAMYVEGSGWISWQEFTMSTKFKGTHLQIVPLGLAHLLITSSGDHYTWRKVMTSVHNIIVGKLWVDNHGEMTITNQKSGDTCILKYEPYSSLSRDTPRKVTGIIYDEKENAVYALNGSWDKEISGSVILDSNETKDKSIFTTSDESKVLWRRTPPPEELKKCHNFSYFAVSLNEPEPGVAPTDSRLRPDQRLMEEGKWPEANDMKIKLEEKQRAARRQIENEKGKNLNDYKPKWFKKEYYPITGGEIHTYNGEYWKCKQEQDWSRCPDIYI